MDRPQAIKARPRTSSMTIGENMFQDKSTSKKSRKQRIPKQEKFCILITKKETDTMDTGEDHMRTVYRRSKEYTGYEEALDKAQEYIGKNCSDQYYIMECVAVVRRRPVEIEIIKVGK